MNIGKAEPQSIAKAGHDVGSGNDEFFGYRNQDSEQE
jgi:hypothetical protein